MSTDQKSNKPIDLLPTVSVLTITRNRKNLFFIAIDSWRRINYPREKLEWIILDDSITNELEAYINDQLTLEERKQVNYKWVAPKERLEILERVCPHNNKWKGYHKLIKAIPIGEKRNMAMDMANNDVCVYMDDDDYYQPQCISTLVKALETPVKMKVRIKHKDTGKVETLLTPEKYIPDYVCVQDLINFDFASCIFYKITADEKKPGPGVVSEASLCHRTKLRDKRRFDPLCSGQEGMMFVNKLKRGEVNCNDVIISITHGQNTSTRNINNSKEITQEEQDEEKLYEVFMKYIRGHYFEVFDSDLSNARWVANNFFSGKTGTFAVIGNSLNEYEYMENNGWKCIFNEDRDDGEKSNLNDCDGANVIFVGSEKQNWFNLIDFNTKPMVIITEDEVVENVLQFGGFTFIQKTSDPNCYWYVADEMM